MKKCMDSDNLHRRLKKIIGQVQAVDRMIDEDVPCEDILSQLNAAKSALNKCGQVVLEGHINHCIKDALERLAKVKRVTFDKTRTLTVGGPKVILAESVTDKYSDEEIYAYTAAAEKNSEHPLGKAIVNCYKNELKNVRFQIQD